MCGPTFSGFNCSPRLFLYASILSNFTWNSCVILQVFYKSRASRNRTWDRQGIPCLLSNKRPKCPSFRAVIGFHVTSPMESSVLFRFATADLFRRIKPCAIVALLA